MSEKPRDVPVSEIWNRVKGLSAQQCAQVLLVLMIANSGNRERLLDRVERVLRGQA